MIYFAHNQAAWLLQQRALRWSPNTAYIGSQYQWWRRQDVWDKDQAETACIWHQLLSVWTFDWHNATWACAQCARAPQCCVLQTFRWNHWGVAPQQKLASNALLSMAYLQKQLTPDHKAYTPQKSDSWSCIASNVCSGLCTLNLCSTFVQCLTYTDAAVSFFCSAKSSTSTPPALLLSVRHALTMDGSCCTRGFNAGMWGIHVKGHFRQWCWLWCRLCGKAGW